MSDGLDSPLSSDGEGDFGHGSALDSLAGAQETSFLDSVLLSEWEDRFQQGLFRYDVTQCPTKVIPGIYGFVAQLNEGRATKKRSTEFSLDKVVQPFDDSKFNFCKAFQKEVLFQFDVSSSGEANYEGSTFVPESPNLVLINVSPIEYGHVLLVPRVADKLPQLVTPESLLTALYFAAQSNNPYFRVGYNSLGAYGTVNHLHFQCFAEKQANHKVPEDVLATGVNPAAFEIAGHIVLKRQEDYEKFTQKDVWKLLEQVSLTEDRFYEAIRLCLGQI